MGWHLFVQVVVVGEDLDNLEILKEVMKDVARLCGVEPVQPQISTVDSDPTLVDSTVDESAIILRMTMAEAKRETQISLLAWPPQRRVAIDLLSCHPFDPTEIASSVANKLGASTYTQTYLERTWPPDPPLPVSPRTT